MRHFHHLLTPALVAAAVATLHPAAAQEKEKDSGPMARFLCVSSLAGDEELVVASKNEDGDWTEHGTVELRPSFVTGWTEAAAGTVHLARREGDGLSSVGSFTIPGSTRRSIVVLIPDPAGTVYRADVIVPQKLGFAKGKALIANYSSVPARVQLGGNSQVVKPGQRVVERAAAGEDGMYRLLVGYPDEDGGVVTCYDRYVSSNPEARDFLLLFPDATSGLKVYTLPEFGPFE